MDFIERWCGISPDGGNGTFEILCITVAVAGIVVLVFRRRPIAVSLRSIGRTDR
jgi:hypothetical protein